MLPLIRKIEPGDVIGRCRTIRELGRGGVGTVYLATHQTLQIEVALKVLSPSLSLDNPALAERFIREAQLAARIRHPNVIAVMDAAHDETTGLYYFVMEYVGGGSLSWHLRHGPLPEAKALAIITGIAHALILAEENRIVHRDIKPDNIMLDLRGTAKLADLGLAKNAIDSRTSLTLGGSFMGTPAYMSPEQARDAKVADTRDDIYSLGATFYECLTGEPPFQGETPYNIMSELLTKPSPKPRVLRPDVSRSADLICRKMMAKSRDLRYADARALLNDLQICQTLGDSGLDRLEASSFDQDSIQIREQALTYGVQTSADGVYVPDLPEDAEEGPIHKPSPALSMPRRTDYGVFGAAIVLIGLVTVATLVLIWKGPRHSNSVAQAPIVSTNQVVVAPPVEVTNTAPVEPPIVVPAHEPTPPTVVTENPPVVVPHEPEVTPIPSGLAPTPEVPTQATNIIDSTNVAPVVAVPAMPAQPDSAFVARNIAESALTANLISSTGHAELLKIVGKRDTSPETTPTTWTFYFFDKSAAGHARIVSVNNGKVIKNTEDIVDSLTAFEEKDILHEDQILTDSNRALELASELIPGITISSSEFVLTLPKNGVPLWKLTLWKKDKEGEERKLGDVSIVAENGFVISKNLKL